MSMAFKFSREQFFAAYRTAFGPLNATQVSGLNDLLNRIEADIAIADIRQFAYAGNGKARDVATAKPIEEKGQGRRQRLRSHNRRSRLLRAWPCAATWIYNYRKFAALGRRSGWQAGTRA